MGSTESVPPAFELTAVDGPWLSPWISIARLSLDAGARGGNGRGARTTAPSLEARNRRLRLRDATLEITLEQMNRALAAVPLADAGVTDARVWMAPDGPRLAGTFAAGNRRAAFTIRPTIEARADGRRRLRVGLSDVRVYGALPLPASLIGLALARAIGAATPDAGPAVRGAGPTLDIDLLALALEQSMVPRGWRLPDLTPGWLEAVDPVAHSLGGGALRLRFRADGRARGTDDDRVAPVVPSVEGERMPEVALGAEGNLNAGDLVAAEAAFAAVHRESPNARPVRARLLALRAAADGADVPELAAAMTAAWPDFVPGWLTAAIAAREAGDARRAADAFGRAAELCEQRDEREDARLARAAEAEARAAAEQVRTTFTIGAPEKDALETTRQDEPRDVTVVAEAPETTQQDQPAETADAIPTPQAPGLTDRTEQAISRGDLDAADALFAQRLEAAADPQKAAALTAERARVQMLGPEGAARALATLREVPLDVMPEEGLVLRVDLEERAGKLADARATLAELMKRVEAAGDAGHVRELARRQAELAEAEAHAAAAAVDAPPPVEDEFQAGGEARGEAGVPEHMATAGSGSITGKTEAVYAADGDPDARAEALGQLLEGFETLEPEDRRHAAYSSFGRVAESTGDLEHAEEAYWRATRVAGDPERRANDLLAHARVLMSRGNVAAAIAELEEALAMVPNHAGALALLADQAFHARNWERARHHYALLDGAPDAADVIERDTLVYRRAVLARAVGEAAEAEACYRELALLSPRHIEARQALAEMAIARDDARTAADRWEEVLRLLPLDALDALLDVRQRLADVYARLADWGAARYYAELVLAQDPGRIAMLERMAEIDEHLGLYPAAVDVLGRLARLYLHPRKRAEALFRQGELLLEHMHDPARAFDAHLKASDLDPTYTPTALRLIEGYWRAGDFGEAADVGEELRHAGPLPDLPPLLRVQWTLAVALGSNGGDAGRALTASGLDTQPWNADLAAAGLAEAAAILAARPPHELEAATAVIEAWSSHDPAAHEAESSGDWLRAALRAQVTKDPATPGAARALGWLADRKGNTLTARALYAAAAFVDDGDGAAGRLDELGLAPAPTEQALSLLGPADHPESSGSAAPLRRTLAALAHALAGFDGKTVPPADEAPPSLSSADLAIEVQADYAALARTLDAPPVALVAAVADTLPAGGLPVVAGRPATVEIPARLIGIAHDELTFLVARALDHLRSGLALVERASEGTADDVGRLLQGAWAALTETALSEPELARAVAEALSDIERRAALLGAFGVERMVEDLDRARDLTAMWTAFRGGVDRASDRFAVLACRNPLAALRALYRADTVTAPGAAELSERERRISFLRTGRVRDLLRFLGSPEYLRALSGDDA